MRVLYICHNDPGFHAGGTESFTRDLARAVDGRADHEAFFLAAVDGMHRERRPGTAVQTARRGHNEAVLRSDGFDRFSLRQTDTYGVFPELERLLTAWRPDVVHLQHYLNLGLEAVQFIRRVCPDVRIVMTLHDYFGLCPQEGTLVRAETHELCPGPTLDRCAKCFPDTARSTIRLRMEGVRRQFSLVDRFIAPSHFLKERYVANGLIAPARIAVVPNGRDMGPPVPPRASRDGKRNRFAFLGHISPFKGSHVALKAARLLVESGRSDFTLTLHGRTEFQRDAFVRRVEHEAAGARRSVAFMGGFEPELLPRIMRETDWVVVPSIWWENAPLVIQEAQHHARPVICSDIGGMAEHVRDGVDGLHFPVGEPQALADRMVRAMDEPGLWDELHANQPSVPDLTGCIDAHLDLYADVRARAEEVA